MNTRCNEASPWNQAEVPHRGWKLCRMPSIHQISLWSQNVPSTKWNAQQHRYCWPETTSPRLRAQRDFETPHIVAIRLFVLFSHRIGYTDSREWWSCPCSLHVHPCVQTCVHSKHHSDDSSTWFGDFLVEYSERHQWPLDVRGMCPVLWRDIGSAQTGVHVHAPKTVLDNFVDAFSQI